MQITVKNNYGETDKYTCSGRWCENCGLRFICFTDRKEIALDWKQFCAIIKSRDKKPQLVYKR